MNSDCVNNNDALYSVKYKTIIAQDMLEDERELNGSKDSGVSWKR